MEIQQEANADLTHAQIGQDLGLVARDKRGNLDFKNDRVLDYDVSAKPNGIVVPL